MFYVCPFYFLCGIQAHCVGFDHRPNAIAYTVSHAFPLNLTFNTKIRIGWFSLEYDYNLYLQFRWVWSIFWTICNIRTKFYSYEWHTYTLYRLEFQTGRITAITLYLHTNWDKWTEIPWRARIRWKYSALHSSNDAFDQMNLYGKSLSIENTIYIYFGIKRHQNRLYAVHRMHTWTCDMHTAYTFNQ